MFIKWNVFLIIAIVFCKSRFILAEDCSALSACSCVLLNGQGFNFEGLSDVTEKGIISVTAKNNVKFQFSPCKNFNGFAGPTETNECNKDDGVSLCAVNGTTKAYSLGKLKDRSIVLNSGDDNMPLLKFKTEKNSSTIIMLCEPDATKPKFTILSEDPLELVLASKFSCKVQIAQHGLSTGSTLLILLFVFSGIYLLGGVLVLKFLRGATGIEMLPNHTFWCDLPGLVRDGVNFTFAGCKIHNYESI